MKQLIDNLGYVGLAALLVSGVYYSITEIWDWRVQTAVYAGAAFLLLYVAFNFKTILGGLTSRSGRQGAAALMTLVMGIGILGLINYLSVRHHKRIDLTEDQLNALSEQTRKVTGGLTEEIEVVAFFTEEGQAQGFQALMREYTFLSSMIKFEVIDPEEEPGRAQDYEASPTNAIFVSRAERREPLDSFSEEKITNAIIKVTRDFEKKIYFLQGHGERDLDDPGSEGYSIVKGEIEKQNYIVAPYALSQEGKLPDDASALVIAGPQVNFLEGEELLLREYLDGGGNIFLLLDPDTNFAMPEFLGNYGIAVDDVVVIDASLQSQLMGAGAATPLVVGYADHAITRDLNVLSYFPMSVSVREAEGSHGFTVTRLAQTSSSSWGEAALEGDSVSFDEEVDLAGPLAIGIVSTRAVTAPTPAPDESSGEEPGASASAEAEDKNGDKETQLVVFGDSDFASNAYFDRTRSANGDLFLNVISFLAEDSDLISVRPKDPTNRTLTLTASDQRLTFWATVVLFPLATLVFGLSVWYRRR